MTNQIIATELDSTPNPSKFIESLRATGYDNYAACLDISDNSIDANATTVKFLIESDTWNGSNSDKENTAIRRILICDNGVGMDKDTLIEAVKLGSLTEHEPSDLGKFGVGLITASISMGRRFSIYTKQKFGELLCVVNDLDVMAEQNKFVSMFYDHCDQQQHEFFNNLVGDNGTIVIIDKLDQIKVKKTTTFAENLTKRCGQVYRYSIRHGKKFFVNGLEVEEVDPLFWKDPNTVQLCNETVPIKVGDEKVDVEVRISVPPPGSGHKGRGWYVLRNYREIRGPMNLFSWESEKRPQGDRFRAEFCFSTELDTDMGTDFKKQRVEPSQSLTDQIESVVAPYIKECGRLCIQQKNQDPKVEEINRKAAAEVSKKIKFLNPLEADHERRQPKKNNNGSKHGKNNNGKTREPGVNRQKGLSDVANFSTQQLGPAGLIFDQSIDGRKINVILNADHPFYKTFCAGREFEDNLSAYLLIYGLARAEAQYLSEENGEMLLNIKSLWSNNVRCLFDPTA